MAGSEDARDWTLTVALGVLSALLLATPAGAEPPSPGASPMVIYRDPATGKLGAPPAGVVPSPPGAAFTGFAPPLVERPGTTPGGGYVVDLPGRFMHRMVVTKGADGRTQVECIDGPPRGDE